MSNQNRPGAQRTDEQQVPRHQEPKPQEPKPAANQQASTSASREKTPEQRAEESRNARAAEGEATRGTGYEVAPGKSITTTRGVIGPGKPIGPRDFVKHEKDREQGLRRLDELVESKYVVRTGRQQ